MTLATVRAISGTADKAPACFLVETPHARLLLDLGYGPRPGCWPDVSGVGRVDAIVLSHGHNDHAGGLSLAPHVGNPPLYGTAATLRMLKKVALPTHEIPVQGETTVCGIRLRTGRNGHAPGGVWLHLDLGGGLLYTGDYCVESLVYVYETPPEAATVILDASYGDYDEPIASSAAKLDAACEGPACLLPVPVWGRGPEIAHHLARSRGAVPRLGESLRAAMAAMARSPDEHNLRSDVVDDFERIAASAGGLDRDEGPLLATPADASSEEAGTLAARWEKGNAHPIVFTGYVPPGTAAQRLTDGGRARYVRWNVHPRLRDNAALVRAVAARCVIPAFGDARHRPAWERAFAPARLAFEDTIAL